MRVVMVEVVTPSRHIILGMDQVVEEVLVHAFIAHSTVEPFNEAVLHRLARRDVVPLDFTVLLPLWGRIAGQLSPVVADHHAGISVMNPDPKYLGTMSIL